MIGNYAPTSRRVVNENTPELIDQSSSLLYVVSSESVISAREACAFDCNPDLLASGFSPDEPRHLHDAELLLVFPIRQQHGSRSKAHIRRVGQEGRSPRRLA